MKVDLLLISEKLKKLVFCELTCLNEENLLSWQKKKEDKYKRLLSSLNKGWIGYLFTLEVGAKGFVVANSFYRFSNFLGLSSRESRSLRDSLSRESLRCSYIIWLNRKNKLMDKKRLTALKIKSLRVYKRFPHSPPVAPQTTIDPAQQLLDMRKSVTVSNRKPRTPTPFVASFLLSLPNIIKRKKKNLRHNN